MRRPSPPAAGDPTPEALGGGARKGALTERERGMPREETVRFCNNPACDGCDVILRPQEGLRKGGELLCPKCLDPLMVRRLRVRPATVPFRPGPGSSPQGPGEKHSPKSSIRNKV